MALGRQPGPVGRGLLQGIGGEGRLQFQGYGLRPDLKAVLVDRGDRGHVLGRGQEEALVHRAEFGRSETFLPDDEPGPRGDLLDDQLAGDPLDRRAHV